MPLHRTVNFGAFQVESYMRITRGQSTLSSTTSITHSFHGSFYIKYLSPSTHWKNCVAISCRGESRRQRYALFSCYVYWLVDPWITAHILRQSTFSMMIPFSTYFYLYRPFLLGEGQQDDAFHVCVSISPRPFPCPYKWYARSMCQHVSNGPLNTYWHIHRPFHS
jgi:hypothetical protein